MIMRKSFGTRLWAAAAVAATTALAAPVSANAQAEAHDLVLPPGQACSFALGIDVGGGQHGLVRDFVDREGTVVRSISAGTGSDLTFTNLANGRVVRTAANGAVTRTVFNADGTSTVTLTGHNVLILFPTDVPAGPSTTLYVGRVTYTVDAQGVYTLRATSGRARDLCAELA